MYSHSYNLGLLCLNQAFTTAGTLSGCCLDLTSLQLFLPQPCLTLFVCSYVNEKHKTVKDLERGLSLSEQVSLYYIPIQSCSYNFNMQYSSTAPFTLSMQMLPLHGSLKSAKNDEKTWNPARGTVPPDIFDSTMLAVPACPGLAKQRETGSIH